jgi:hypothetical protein
MLGLIPSTNEKATRGGRALVNYGGPGRNRLSYRLVDSWLPARLVCCVPDCEHSTRNVSTFLKHEQFFLFERLRKPTDAEC